MVSTTNQFTPVQTQRIGSTPLNMVTPFTYRDNITYAEILFEMVEWFDDTHLPELDKWLVEFKEQYEKDHADILADIIATKNEWQLLFDLFMENVNEKLEALNDVAVSALVRSRVSELRKALDENSRVYTIPRVSGMADHTNYLRGEIAYAVGRGFRNIFIPSLSLTNNSPWILSDQLNLTEGVCIDAKTAYIMQKNYLRPAFYIPPYVDNVEVHVLECYGETRPVYTDYPTGTVNGAEPLASNTGVMSHGSHGVFTGHFRKFRNGVRLGNFAGGTGTTTEGRRDRNIVDITVDEVDFGIVYAGQKFGVIDVAGSYVPTEGTNDPPHLIYAAGPADDMTVNGDAYGGSGVNSVAFIFKQQHNLNSTLLRSKGTEGILSIENGSGIWNLGSVVGSDITSEALRSAGDVAPDKINLVTLNVSMANVTTSNRIAALKDNWHIQNISATYYEAEIIYTQSGIHIYGNGNLVDFIEITNRSSVGGYQGVRFAGGSNNTVSQAPVLNGVSHGVVIEATSLNARVVVIDELIVSRGVESLFVNNNIGNAVSIIREPQKRVNRWYAHPLTSALVDVVVSNNMVRMTSMPVHSAFVISKMGIQVAGYVSAYNLRLGIYLDNGRGVPGSLIATTNEIAITANGINEFTFTAPVKLNVGQYWLAVIATGGAGSTLRGVASYELAIPTLDSAQAMTGGAFVINSVTAFPTLADNVSNSQSGAPRFVMYVV